MPIAISKSIPLFGRICALIGVCCLINLAVWCYYDVKYGGNAINGSIEGGRFYFSEHGMKTEVSAEVWRFSKVYTKVTIALFAVGAISLLIFGAYANAARERIVE